MQGAVSGQPAAEPGTGDQASGQDSGQNGFAPGKKVMLMRRSNAPAQVKAGGRDIKHCAADEQARMKARQEEYEAAKARIFAGKAPAAAAQPPTATTATSANGVCNGSDCTGTSASTSTSTSAVGGPAKAAPAIPADAAPSALASSAIPAMVSTAAAPEIAPPAPSVSKGSKAEAKAELRVKGTFDPDYDRSHVRWATPSGHQPYSHRHPHAHSAAHMAHHPLPMGPPPYGLVALPGGMMSPSPAHLTGYYGQPYGREGSAPPPSGSHGPWQAEAASQHSHRGLTAPCGSNGAANPFAPSLPSFAPAHQTAPSLACGRELLQPPAPPPPFHGLAQVAQHAYHPPLPPAQAMAPGAWQQCHGSNHAAWGGGPPSANVGGALPWGGPPGDMGHWQPGSHLPAGVSSAHWSNPGADAVPGGCTNANGGCGASHTTAAIPPPLLPAIGGLPGGLGAGWEAPIGSCGDASRQRELSFGAAYGPPISGGAASGGALSGAYCLPSGTLPSSHASLPLPVATEQHQPLTSTAADNADAIWAATGKLAGVLRAPEMLPAPLFKSEPLSVSEAAPRAGVDVMSNDAQTTASGSACGSVTNAEIVPDLIKQASHGVGALHVDARCSHASGGSKVGQSVGTKAKQLEQGSDDCESGGEGRSRVGNPLMEQAGVDHSGPLSLPAALGVVPGGGVLPVLDRVGAAAPADSALALPAPLSLESFAASQTCNVSYAAGTGRAQEGDAMRGNCVPSSLTAGGGHHPPFPQQTGPGGRGSGSGIGNIARGGKGNGSKGSNGKGGKGGKRTSDPAPGSRGRGRGSRNA